jgi:ribonuclease P/MRP protein subunit RPP40
MLTFLDEHNLITDSQHGFVPAKSCTTNLLETLGIITTALSQNHEVVIVLLDFTKAFDKVSHELLPVKLKALWFDNKLIKCVTSFLANTSNSRQIKVWLVQST